MLRFKPDDWLEGLLRPFLLVDPNGYVYIELQAPDLRFAALAALTLLLMLARRLAAPDAKPAARTLVGVWLIFYVWVFAIGNGRYFVAGLLLAGPLIVALVARAPLTWPMRVTVLAGVVGLQAMVVHQHFHHGAWALARWSDDGPGLPLRDTPLRHEPAIFLTTTSISGSILVPQFDSRARWANIAGQVDVTPDRLEWAPLRALLASPLPKYTVLPILGGAATDDAQPTAEVDQMLRLVLAQHGLDRHSQPCEVIPSHLRIRDLGETEEETRPLAYWFCPLRADPAGALTTTADPPTNLHDDVFAAVERHCPKYFPPGTGKRRVAGQVTMRHYNGADTRLYVDGHGNVLYRYTRAFNPTYIGTAEQVRRGEFAIDCRKLPGRYVYPWQRS